MVYKNIRLDVSLNYLVLLWYSLFSTFLALFVSSSLLSLFIIEDQMKTRICIGVFFVALFRAFSFEKMEKFLQSAFFQHSFFFFLLVADIEQKIYQFVSENESFKFPFLSIFFTHQLGCLCLKTYVSFRLVCFLFFAFLIFVVLCWRFY